MTGGNFTLSGGFWTLFAVSSFLHLPAIVSSVSENPGVEPALSRFHSGDCSHLEPTTGAVTARTGIHAY
jgi:hypothetical protein